jgi:hypothetical protein
MRGQEIEREMIMAIATEESEDDGLRLPGWMSHQDISTAVRVMWRGYLRGLSRKEQFRNMLEAVCPFTEGEEQAMNAILRHSHTSRPS